ncbi:MAG: hypothetical protein OHK0023_25800 [Anaerolineae bacterium]
MTDEYPETTQLESGDLARLIIDLISDRKGENMLMMDLRQVSIIADYFVIASANSDRQLGAITEHVRDEVKKQTRAVPLRVEGRGESGWILMDYGDVIVHLFLPQTRAYYDLEGLWREAPVVLRMQ